MEFNYNAPCSCITDASTTDCYNFCCADVARGGQVLSWGGCRDSIWSKVGTPVSLLELVKVCCDIPTSAGQLAGCLNCVATDLLGDEDDMTLCSIAMTRVSILQLCALLWWCWQTILLGQPQHLELDLCELKWCSLKIMVMVMVIASFLPQPQVMQMATLRPIIPSTLLLQNQHFTQWRVCCDVAATVFALIVTIGG